MYGVRHTITEWWEKGKSTSNQGISNQKLVNESDILKLMSHNIQKLHMDFLEELEIGLGRSQKTVENYDRYLRRFYGQEKIEKLSDITQDAVREFRRYLSELAPRPHDIAETGVSLATQNYHLIALRQFLRYLVKRDIDALSPDKIVLAKTHERDIDVLYPEEIDALLGAAKAKCQNSNVNSNPKFKEYVACFRDCAILEVLFSTGMRVSELVSLNRDDIRKNSNEIAVRGKGNKVRVVFLSSSAQESIAAYIEKREDMDPALFIQHSRNIKAGAGLRMTPRSVQRMMKKYAAKAGLTKDITPHTMRHSFATDLLSNGADVRQVQQLLGHASITTTQVYTHLTDVQLRDVHEKYHRKSEM